MLPGGARDIALGGGGGGGLRGALPTGLRRRGCLVCQLGEHGHGDGLMETGGLVDRRTAPRDRLFTGPHQGGPREGARTSSGRAGLRTQQVREPAGAGHVLLHSVHKKH